METTMIDLHIHTQFSDGSCSPAEVLDLANKNNVKIISFTDHDVVPDISEERKLAEKLGIRIINGIEFSIGHESEDIHILGYGYDVQNKEFCDLVKKLADCRQKELIRVIRGFRKNGIDLPLNRLLKDERGDCFHGIARMLVENGFANDESEAKREYLCKGGKVYVKKYRIQPQEAIDIIHNAGGVAVLAHPNRYFHADIFEIDKLLRYYVELGLDGIELFHPSNIMGEDVKQLSEKYNLCITGGSDYHNTLGAKIGTWGKQKSIMATYCSAFLKRVLRKNISEVCLDGK